MKKNIVVVSYSDAKKMVQAQHNGSEVVIVNCRDLTTGDVG